MQWSLTKYGSWTHLDNHHLSDTLLTMIEGKAHYKVAFGIDKGNITLVPMGGKKIIDHYRTIACELFVDLHGQKCKASMMDQITDAMAPCITVKSRFPRPMLNKRPQEPLSMRS